MHRKREIDWVVVSIIVFEIDMAALSAWTDTLGGNSSPSPNSGSYRDSDARPRHRTAEIRSKERYIGSAGNSASNVSAVSRGRGNCMPSGRM